ncbi:MAG: chemotaxis protein CheW [Gammaproteobacteria bacterium]|nr:MAG: chemotaxis protein CheW [Gammaproteobacteria bacterium]
MLAERLERLRVLQIPLEAGTRLLVPNVAVAEVIPSQPVEAVPVGPLWLEGMMDWRGHRVPLVCLEKLLGLPAGETAGEGPRIAVFNRSRKEGRPPFYAVRLQGIPRLARVAESDVRDLPGDDATGFMHVHVEVGGERFVIPDLVVIEATIENGMRQAGLC